MANSNETYTQEEQERIDAVNRYHMGERPTKICKTLGRSRPYLGQYFLRYNSESGFRWIKDDFGEGGNKIGKIELIRL